MPKPKDKIVKAELDNSFQGIKASFATRITYALTAFGTEKNGTQYPSKPRDELDQALADAFMWDTIAKYAEKKSEAAWKLLEEEQFVGDYKNMEPGEHEIAHSASFISRCKVSQPIVRFDNNEMAQLLVKSKYKVPLAVTLEYIDKAKVPKNSSRTLVIEERTVKMEG